MRSQQVLFNLQSFSLQRRSILRQKDKGVNVILINDMRNTAPCGKTNNAPFLGTFDGIYWCWNPTLNRWQFLTQPNSRNYLTGAIIQVDNDKGRRDNGDNRKVEYLALNSLMAWKIPINLFQKAESLRRQLSQNSLRVQKPNP